MDKSESMMQAIHNSVVNPSVGDRVASELWHMGYEIEVAGRIGLLYDQGVRDGRMPDAALVLGARFEIDSLQ